MSCWQLFSFLFFFSCQLHSFIYFSIHLQSIIGGVTPLWVIYGLTDKVLTARLTAETTYSGPCSREKYHSIIPHHHRALQYVILQGKLKQPSTLVLSNFLFFLLKQLQEEVLICFLLGLQGSALCLWWSKVWINLSLFQYLSLPLQIINSLHIILHHHYISRH